MELTHYLNEQIAFKETISPPLQQAQTSHYAYKEISFAIHATLKTKTLKKKKTIQKLFFFCAIIYFCKLPQSALSQGQDEGLMVLGFGLQAQLLQKLCGMKYMHKSKRGQQADKLTTPQP